MPRASDDTLSDLLARVALRDRRAFEALYRASSAQLFGIVLRIVRQRELAADVLQEAYVRIWDHADAYRPDLAKPLTWMGTIARNKAIDVLRRYGSRPVMDTPVDEMGWLADDNPGPREQVDQAQWDERLHQCLKGLNPTQRRALQMAFFRGLTHEELASELGTPLGTVKSWIRRGMMQLKQCLDET